MGPRRRGMNHSHAAQFAAMIGRGNRRGQKMSQLARALLSAMVLLAAAPASADSIEDFYRGKQIKIYVRAAAGGNYDVYSRVLGRHMTRFIPGHPTVLPINMPGGGGIVALNYVANVAPKDGTVLTMITQSFPMDQALGLDKNLKIDLRTLNFIGNMSDTNEFFMTAKGSATKTLEDAKRRETVMAATGIGSIVTRLAALYNNTLGTKFKVIYGYPSGPDMTLALERGEVEGRSTSNPQVLAPTKAEILAKYNFLIQAGMRKVPQYEEIPLLRDLARTDEEQRIFDFISRAVVLARPLVTNAGVPAERVAALRRAFDATMLDPLFLEDAMRQSLEINGKGGEELQKMVNDMIGTPAPVLEKVARAIQLNSAEAVRGARPDGG
jgi:tripartite-type tricarboxylate transporter receptor subunit TctC